MSSSLCWQSNLQALLLHFADHVDLHLIDHRDENFLLEHDTALHQQRHFFQVFLPDRRLIKGFQLIEFIDAEDLEGIVRHRKRRHASRKESKLGKARQQERRDRGLPPWASLESEGRGPAGAEIQHTKVLKSSQTLREWADEYCASDKVLKEFTYEKVVVGLPSVTHR